MIDVVIHCSTIMQKSIYIIVSIEVLVNIFAVYVEFCVISELHATTTISILGIRNKGLHKSK